MEFPSSNGQPWLWLDMETMTLNDTRPPFHEVVGSFLESWYFPNEEVLKEEERLVDFIWESIVYTYEKEISESTSDSNLIYHNILHAGLLATQKHWQHVDNSDALVYIDEALLLLDKICSVVTWESYSDRALEYLYISEEINDILDDETDSQVVKVAVWIDLCASSLYEVLYHLIEQRDHQDDSEEKEIFRKLIEVYRGVAERFFASLKSMETE